MLRSVVMKIIENQSEFKLFIKEFRTQASILIPIPIDSRQHPASNGLCLMGVCRIDSGEVAILPFNHPEATNLPTELINELAQGLELWTPDTKSLSCLPIARPLWEPIKDIQSLEYLSTGNVTDQSEFYCSTIRHSHERHYNDGNVNRAIPLYRWAEFIERYCVKLCEIIELHGSEADTPGYDFLVGTAIPALQGVESNGLHVDPIILTEHFGISNRFVIHDTVYSQYNLFTATGRPSCAFGGINFAALKKDSGERAAFTSRFHDGMLVNIDFESYHVRLIANHLRYKLPSLPAHEYFGRYYFGTNNLTDEQYEESKRRTFKLLYSSEPSDVPFFAKVAEFKAQMWDEIQSVGYIESPIAGKKMRLDHIYQARPSKVFNYFVQWLETEQNLVSLLGLQKMFESRRSKIVLYNYDSFLIDFSMGDGGDLLLDVVSYLEQDKKFPVRVKYGKNFNEMKALNSKYL